MKIPSFAHETLQDIFFTNQNSNLRQLVHATGSADIDLFGKTQTKSPDLSFGERRKDTDGRDIDHDINSSPTVVIEVGFKELMKKLNFDAARLLLGNCLIQLVINIKIMTKGNKLKWITVDLWSSSKIKRPEG